MTEPTTLGGLLEWLSRPDYFESGHEEQGAARALLDRILYGTDEPCPGCGGTGFSYREYYAAPCLMCHGTGRLKTPGLVERLKQEVLGAAESDELPKSAGAAYGIVLAAEALRREIGEATP